MERAPHYLRFARALALLTGLAGIPACTETGEVVADGGPAPRDAAADAGDLDASTSSADGGDTTPDGGDTTPDGGDTTPDGGGAAPDGGDRLADAGGPGLDAGDVVPDAGVPFDCAACDCFGAPDVDAGVPSCFPDHAMCCVAIGPLSPPDLLV